MILTGLSRELHAKCRRESHPDVRASAFSRDRSACMRSLHLRGVAGFFAEKGTPCRDLVTLATSKIFLDKNRSAPCILSHLQLSTVSAPQPRAATSKRLYRTRAELPASPFTPERERASGKALTLIRRLAWDCRRNSWKTRSCLLR
jgi:hypothetical protein